MNLPAVGLDIGNSKCVVAMSTDGVVDAVLNEESKRETPTVVHLADNHRLFGTYGASLATTNPTSTISQLKRLVGLRFDDTMFQAERLLLPYETSEDADGEISVKVSSGDVTAVEMLAMLISHLKRTAELTTAATMFDCVIGVPAYFTSKQKNAYWDAALIAGWNPLGLLHEGVATALEYAADKPDVDAPSVVAFVDIGHCDTQVTVVRFRGKEMKVLGEAWDAYLGGRDFDEFLFQHFMGVFENEYCRRDIRSDVKACVRLRTACEKAKRVLSANKEADVSIDYLMEGVEYASGVITRDKFEELSKGLVDRIGVVFCEALKRAKVVAKEIDSVELVGSGSRIPAISRILTGMLGRGLSRTLNGSECIARGCARLHDKHIIPSAAPNPSDIDPPPYEQKKKWGLTNNVFTFGNKKDIHLSSSIEGEALLLMQDKSYEEAKHRRNAIESRIYQVRKEVEEQRTNMAESKGIISRMLEEMELWLYENGDGVSQDVYDAQMKVLNKVISKKYRSLSSDALERKLSKTMINLKLESTMSYCVPLVGTSSSSQEVHRQGHKNKARPCWPDKRIEGHKDKKDIMKSVLRLTQKNKK